MKPDLPLRVEEFLVKDPTDPVTIRNLNTERQAAREADADRARELVEQALDYESDPRRLHGPDRLLAAAQVYATLALRA